MNPELTREALSRFCSDEAKNAKEVGGLFYTYQGVPALERGRRVVIGRQCPHIKVTETIYEMSEGVIL
ncbi:MAG TPA: hypothetical protein VN456_14670 [Desulfosporosinus sp.]|nr:hypothetical protein [Desulfosporosinus sp.]